MSPKRQVIVVILALIATFAAGRYTAPTKTVIETKYVTLEIEHEQTEDEKHAEKWIEEITHPDGTKEKKTHLVESNNRKTDVDKKESVMQDTKKEVIYGSNSYFVSVMGGFDNLHFVSPIFGAQISKSILGPITVGVWGLSNITGGVSVGLNF